MYNHITLSPFSITPLPLLSSARQFLHITSNDGNRETRKTANNRVIEDTALRAKKMPARGGETEKLSNCARAHDSTSRALPGSAQIRQLPTRTPRFFFRARACPSSF